jgi:hypothetical protein
MLAYSPYIWAQLQSKTFFADACLPLWGKRASKQEIEKGLLISKHR